MAHRNTRHGKGDIHGHPEMWRVLVFGAAVGGLYYLMRQTHRSRQHRPADSAPRYVRQHRSGDYAVTGRTVTIARPRNDVYAFWRDFTNLPSFMENVRSVDVSDDLTRWVIAGPAGTEIKLETRIVEDRENEHIAWRSTSGSDIDTRGSVSFRDAPGGRGTEVEAQIAYVPPGGAVGRWIAKAFQREPAMQGRRELKRLKMLMETGEIATSNNRKPNA